MDSVRIDKWLWAARFFKTRAMARKAADGGKIDLNGQRAKPSKAVKPGDVLRIQRDQSVFLITVNTIGEKRVGAAIAATWYEEDEASQSLRLEQDAARRADWKGRAERPRRPDKKERRSIRRFKEGAS